MPTTYTGVPANVTASASPTISEPIDGDGDSASSFNPAFQKLCDYAANIFNSIINGFAAPLKLASQAAPLQAAGYVNALTPNAGWAASDGFGYWKDTGGMVHVRGGCTAPSSGSAASPFTLPVGFRPANVNGRWFPIIDTVSGVGFLQLKSDGTTVILGGGAVTHQYYFDAIHFLAEQ